MIKGSLPGDDEAKLKRFMRAFDIEAPRTGIFDSGQKILAKFTKTQLYGYGHSSFLDHLRGFVFSFRTLRDTDALVLVSQPYGLQLEKHGDFCSRHGLLAYVFGRDWAWHNPTCDVVVFVHPTIGKRDLARIEKLPWVKKIRPTYEVVER